MPRVPLYAASGSGVVLPFKKAIRLERFGCANRPFYHIVVTHTQYKKDRNPPIEQLGTYDPVPNFNNEKLCSLNFERLEHWIGRGVKITKPISHLLGLAGFFPIHQKTYLLAWRKRRARDEAEKKEKEEAEKAANVEEDAAA